MNNWLGFPKRIVTRLAAVFSMGDNEANSVERGQDAQVTRVQLTRRFVPLGRVEE